MGRDKKSTTHIKPWISQNGLLKMSSYEEALFPVSQNGCIRAGETLFMDFEFLPKWLPSKEAIAPLPTIPFAEETIFDLFLFNESYFYFLLKKPVKF